MTPDQFWYDDIDYFEAYIKAYQNKIEMNTWMNGLYVYKALESAIINFMPDAIGIAFSDGKRQIVQYPSKPFNLHESSDETEEDNAIATISSDEEYANALKRLNSIAQ